MRAESLALKQFLFRELYRHAQVMSTMVRAQQVVKELFAIYFEKPSEMPAAQAAQALAGDVLKRARVVADFIAGMTDRYAGREHERLTGERLLNA